MGKQGPRRPNGMTWSDWRLSHWVCYPPLYSWFGMTRVCFYGLDSQTHRYIGLLEGVLSECQQNLIFFFERNRRGTPLLYWDWFKERPKVYVQSKWRERERDGKEKIKKKKKEKKEPRFDSMKKWRHFNHEKSFATVYRRVQVLEHPTVPGDPK